jgi:hypothetical protein
MYVFVNNNFYLPLYKGCLARTVLAKSPATYMCGWDIFEKLWISVAWLMAIGHNL